MRWSISACKLRGGLEHSGHVLFFQGGVVFLFAAGLLPFVRGKTADFDKV